MRCSMLVIELLSDELTMFGCMVVEVRYELWLDVRAYLMCERFISLLLWKLVFLAYN